MTQRVSVVIPLYNHANYITAAIQSVLAQGQIVGEIIVINDGSTDTSSAVMADLVHLDPRIIFWSQPNRGAHATLNAGMARATGDILAILNSDDIYAPGRLTRLVAALDLDLGADLAASSIKFIDGNGTEITNSWHNEALGGFKARGDLGLSLMDANFLMTTSNFVMRRTLVEKIGAFAPLRYAHDLDFGLRAAANGCRLAFVDEKLLAYRFHATNTIHENHSRVRWEWAIAAAHFLHRVTTSTDHPDVDWDRIKQAFAIAQKHSLAQAIEYSIIYFSRHPVNSLERSQILYDRKFDKIMMECLQ